MPRSPSAAYARPSPGASIKSPELNAPRTSQIQGMVNLNGDCSSEIISMNGLRGWIIFAWIALPTVMYGGYSLIQLINRGSVLTSAQVGFFRVGHAHAGVLTLMSLLYYTFLDQTSLS